MRSVRASLLVYALSAELRKLVELADDEVGWEVAEQLSKLFKSDMLDTEELDDDIKHEKITEAALRDIYDFCVSVRQRGLDTKADDCLDLILFLEEWSETEQDINPDIKKHLSPVWKAAKPLPAKGEEGVSAEQKSQNSA